MQKKIYKRVLTIAGSDSGGGAGIQADLKTFGACGCYGMSAITALTAQNTLGVTAIHIPPTEIVVAQVRAVLDDIGVDAVKVGMLPNEEIIVALAGLFAEYGVTNIVLDPVMVATSGDKLISRSAADAIVNTLLPMATLVTPNIPEAEYMTGGVIGGESDFGEIANRFRSLGAKNILLKAGHLPNSQTLTDHLYLGDREYLYSSAFVDTPNTHGTGCTLSSAIAAYLAHGETLPEAVASAKEYLTQAIICGTEYSIGSGHGPVHHYYKFWK